MDCPCYSILDVDLDKLPDHICDDIAALSLQLLGENRPSILAGRELLAVVQFATHRGTLRLFATKGGVSIPLAIPLGIPRFGEPVFVLESRGVDKTLDDAKLKLQRWYDKTLLGKPLRTGRPRGTGTFENRAAFVTTFGPAVQELRSRGRNPTTGAVLKHLRTRFGNVDKSQLTRWYQGLGWRSWQDFLADLNDMK